jgi:AbiV family abortive infection protein
MKNLKKAAKLAALSFSNGIRLHKDSILLYKNASIPSSYQLSILAQEEIGKAFLLEEHVFRSYEHKGEGNPTYKSLPEIQKWLSDDFVSHKSKQIWFSRQADETRVRKGSFFPKYMQDASSGLLEKEKQNSIYVGLTKNKGRINLNGKRIDPIKRINNQKTKKHITRVNDFITVLIEGCRRGTHGVDTEDLDNILTIALLKELEQLWPEKSLYTKNVLKKIRKFSLEND